MLEKWNKKILLWLIASVVVAAGAYAYTVLSVFNVVPSGNCVETDFGLDFRTAGSITGKFQGSFGTVQGTYHDFCVSNTDIYEFVCGTSLSNSSNKYAGLAAIVWEDCTTLGGSGVCRNGRCV